MNRRKVLQSLAASAAVCCVPWASGWGALGNMRRLAMTTRYDVKHEMIQDVILPWVSSLRDRSHGRLDIGIVSPDILCPDAEVFNALLVDTVSLGCISPSALVPPLPVSLLFDYPSLFPNAEIGSQVVWEIFCHNQEIQREFALVHVLWGWVSAPMYLHTVKKPVCTLHDVKGLKLVVWSALDEIMVQAMGGVPLYSSPANSTNLLRLGRGDGVVCPFPPMASFGIDKQIHYTTDVPLNGVCFFLAMNKDVWIALPPEHQDLLTKMSGRHMAALCGKKLDDTSRASRNVMQSKGHTFLSLSPSVLSLWECSMQGLSNAWEDKLVAKKLLSSKGLLQSIFDTSKRIEREMKAQQP